MSQKLFIKDEFSMQLIDIETGEVKATFECLPVYVHDKPDEVIYLGGKIDESTAEFSASDSRD